MLPFSFSRSCLVTLPGAALSAMARACAMLISGAFLAAGVVATALADTATKRARAIRVCRVFMGDPV